MLMAPARLSRADKRLAKEGADPCHVKMASAAGRKAALGGPHCTYTVPLLCGIQATVSSTGRRIPAAVYNRFTLQFLVGLPCNAPE
jgi:hypothetical protein